MDAEASLRPATAEYLAELQGALTEAVQLVLQERPEEPVRVIAERLHAHARNKQDWALSRAASRVSFTEDSSTEVQQPGFRRSHTPDVRQIQAAIRNRPERRTTVSQYRTEERGITLQQLRAFYALIMTCCERDGWVDYEGRPLTPERVNLHDACKYVIKPATAQRQCSWVDLVANGPQRPKWFVSHWWGHPVLMTLRCIEQHAVDHGYDENVCYWVCAYAINQHDMNGDLRMDPSECAFVRAIDLVDGRVLSVLDAEGMALKRIWCCLEVFFGLASTYEMYTYCATKQSAAYDLKDFGEISRAVSAQGLRGSDWLAEVVRRLPVRRDRHAVGMTDGPVAVDNAKGVAAYCQTFRQSFFPVSLIRHASAVRVQECLASFEADKRHILNFMAGRCGADLDAPVLSSCAAYDEWSRGISAKVVAASWRLLLEAGEDMHASGAMLAESSVTKLVLSFRHCAAFDDAMAALLAASMPVPLEEVRDGR